MKLAEASAIIQTIEHRPFSEFLSPAQIKSLKGNNKGKAGQILELFLGLGLSNRTLDFSDGELKTNSCDLAGVPKQTLAITQLGNTLDDCLRNIPFEETVLYKK